jgi:hypothetical protein
MADSKFPIHSIVEKIGDTPATKLMGYFGSTSDGKVTIHPRLDDLSSYVRVSEADILHVEDAPADILPHGGSMIWLKADAPVEYGVSTQTQARFLTGGIGGQMAGGAARTAAGGGGGLEPDTANCNGFSVWPCSVIWGACLPSAGDPCVNTQQFWCPVVVSANTCFTCAGFTCVANCYSAGCPPHPTQFCTHGRITLCCEIVSAVCPR